MKSMLKFRDIILGKKDDSPDSSQKKGDAKQGEDSLSPVAAEQVKILMELYQEVHVIQSQGILKNVLKILSKVFREAVCWKVFVRLSPMSR